MKLISFIFQVLVSALMSSSLWYNDDDNDNDFI